MESTNKKRTAVVAVAVAAALALSGTFAWNLATDQTLLNEFEQTDNGIYDVELDENFDPADPWANKDVFVTNTGDNPVIVRVRLEEFYDLTYRNGTDYNVAEGYQNGDAGSSAIFNVPTDSTLEGTDADSSTALDDKITLIFASGVVTMDAYNAMTDEEKAAVKWVVDADGWCYYTRALLAGETTEYLLDDVDFNKDIFEAQYDSPYDLDYRINVRLQAISADLEDFGSHLNDAQWTNVAYLDAEGNEVTDNAGRVIAEDDRADDYEILADSTITDEALNIVIGIRNAYTNQYANEDDTIAVKVSTAEELKTAIDDVNTHSILLTSNIETTESFTISTDKFIELGEYTLTKTAGSTALFNVDANATLTIKHGNVVTNGQDFAEDNGTVTLVGVNVSTGDGWGVWLRAEDSRVEMYGSTINASAPIAIDGNTPTGSVRADNSSVYLNNTSIIATGSYAILNNTDGFANAAQNVSIVIENGSQLEGANGICLVTGWTLDAKDSTIIANGAGCYGITENYNYVPGDVYLENCTIKAAKCYYKPADSKLVMKNCKLNAVGFLDPNDESSGYCSTGICIRSGDVTLDNVEITADQGTFPDGDWMRSQDELRTKYNSTSSLNGFTSNFEAIQVLLNQYENIKLNIIGGSYTATYGGHNIAGDSVDKNAVFVYDSGASIHSSDYQYENTINISDNPTFDPTFSFADSYKNTTVTQ